MLTLVEKNKKKTRIDGEGIVSANIIDMAEMVVNLTLSMSK
jgi:hypothetical protein